VVEKTGLYSFLVLFSMGITKGKWSTVGRLEPRPTSGLVRLPEFLPGSQQTRYYRIEVREP